MPWTIIQDLFYTVWAEDTFFYFPDADWEFYFVEETEWAEDDYFYVPDGPWGPNFYLSDETWLLPLTISYDHIKATANPEELVVKPEDFGIVPENIQFRRTEWEAEEPETTSWTKRNT